MGIDHFETLRKTSAKEYVLNIVATKALGRGVEKIGNGSIPESGYTPARKRYMHKLLFLELISRKITCQLHKHIFLKLIPENYISRIRS